MKKTDNDRRQQADEAEVARRIEKSINEAKAAVSEKLEDSKVVVERLLKQSRYAMEDGIGEMAHTIKRNPIGFVGAAFAVGLALGALLPLMLKPSRSGANRE